LKIKEVQRSRT